MTLTYAYVNKYWVVCSYMLLLSLTTTSNNNWTYRASAANKLQWSN